MPVSPRITSIYEDVMFAKKGCLDWVPCLVSNRSCRERIPGDHHGCGCRWWKRGCKKFREWSKRVDGPKWKTFIRQFKKKNKRSSGYKRFGKNKFNNYDLASYSLNFDEGQEQRYSLVDDCLYKGSSSRYAVVPAPAKSSTFEPKWTIFDEPDNACLTVKYDTI